MKNLYKYVLVATTLMFAVLLFFNVLQRIDWDIQDRWLQDGHQTDSRISILAIDDTSLQSLGHWPWNRGIHAQLVNKLSEGGAAVVGFDITFPLASENVEEDQSFVNNIKEADNVVLARYGSFANFYKEGTIEAVELSEPFSELKEAATALGHLNTIPDDDGVVRKALYHFSFEGERIESFAATIAKLYGEKTGQPITIDESALNAYEQFHIDYAGEPGDFEVIPYSMVINGEVPPQYFKNRIVLIGPYTVGIKDDFLTPMNAKQHMFGVEIHANIIQAILDENYKKEVPFIWNVLLLIVSGIIIYFITKLKSNALSLGLLVVYGAIVLFAAKILYNTGFIMSLVYIFGLLIVSYIASVATNYILELSERKRVTNIFSRYVAPQVVTQILEDGEEGLKLGGSRKEVTIIFVDIRGFTTLSESVEPEEIVAILNEYLDLTANCIFEYGGTLDKFIGDATMAIFNAPLPLDDHEMQAVKTAWAMKQGAIELEKQLQERFGKSVQFGIGIHTGAAVVGNIGSKTRMDYTAIGDTVNTAARLESNSKPGQIILSEQVYEKVKDRIYAKSLGVIQVKGKVNGISIYELEGLQ